jgi:hypothetical protein
MPTVDITYKICTRCNQTRDVLLFHMKNKTKRKSHCRFCTSSFPRSDYNYPTKKQQELAQQNLKILTKELIRFKKGRTLCICGNKKLPNRKKCNDCVTKATKEAKRRASKRRDKNKERNKRKATKKIKELKNSYISHMIKVSIKTTTGVVIEKIPQDVIEVKRKQLLLTRQLNKWQKPKQ